MKLKAMHKDLTPEEYNKAETSQHLLHAMIEVLHDAGFRVTNQRKIILEAVACQVGWHVHPKDVYSYVQERDKTIGLATVYRTLKMLEDMDLLNKIYLMGMQEDHEMEHGKKHHYHLICLKCGSIMDINDTVLGDIPSHIKRDYGFETTQIKMSIYGLCEDCRRISKLEEPKQ
ncbi:MAG: Fur family transcriptional regulator [Oscillospiraceae bacterium]|nr:Fur family transcriptional regulator [Oscillospiraceae bacterium]